MKTEKEIKLRKTEPLYMATIVFQKFKDKKEAYWKGYRDAIKWVLEDSSPSLSGVLSQGKEKDAEVSKNG